MLVARRDGALPEFPHWLGPICMVCPLAPLLDELFHYGGRSQNYSAIVSISIAITSGFGCGNGWRVCAKITSDTYESAQSFWAVIFDPTQELVNLVLHLVSG